MDRLFVVNKPIFISSNRYINSLKREFNTKKIGYSGTLDPFATGTLIAATGKYTKLFPYLKKSPKIYLATLWLGAESKSLDIENIESIKSVNKIPLDMLKEAILSLRGEIEYYPPKFSAKRVNGKRAYDLARAGEEVELKRIKSTIYDIELLNYSHPFIHFRVSVSEGAYIRSIAQILASKLKVVGTLSSLKRVREGEFFFEDKRALNPLEFLKIPRNIYLGDEKKVALGKKLSLDEFKEQRDGVYFVEFSEFFSIIEIKDSFVSYRLNLIPKAKV
jgi:tRNA pseudouridine55 synthase